MISDNVDRKRNSRSTEGRREKRERGKGKKKTMNTKMSLIQKWQP